MLMQEHKWWETEKKPPISGHERIRVNTSAMRVARDGVAMSDLQLLGSSATVEDNGNNQEQAMTETSTTKQ